jgi:hypothetical protein
VRISTRERVEADHQPTWPRRTRCKEGNFAHFYDHYGYDHSLPGFVFRTVASSRSIVALLIVSSFSLTS